MLVTVVHRVPPDKTAGFRVQHARSSSATAAAPAAYQWGLYRDLADPDRFLESFVVDSWAEHLRQHQRSTATSDVRLDEVRPFHEAGIAVADYVSAYSPGAIDLVDVQLSIDDRAGVMRHRASAWDAARRRGAGRRGRGDRRRPGYLVGGRAGSSRVGALVGGGVSSSWAVPYGRAVARTAPYRGVRVCGASPST